MINIIVVVKIICTHNNINKSKPYKQMIFYLDIEHSNKHIALIAQVALIAQWPANVSTGFA